MRSSNLAGINEERMKQSAKRIGLIILIAVLALIECGLCIGVALDGKYQVELSEDLGAIDAFYRDVTILEIFMFINLGIAVVSLILLWRNSKVKKSSGTRNAMSNWNT